MTRRRGFTLIELVLAATLGVMVVATCWGLMSMVNVSEKRSERRADGLRELAMMQEVFEKSFRTLVLMDKPVKTSPTREAPSAQKSKPSDAPGSRPDVDDPKGERKQGEKNAGLPRLVLELDERNAPRLELVTASEPLAVRGRDGRPTFVSAERGGGVRCAFELAPGRREGTSDLWLRAYELEGGIDGPRTPVGEVLVAKGLSELKYTFFKTNPEGQTLAELVADKPVDWSSLPEDADARYWSTIPMARSFVHLPAYVEVEAATWQGPRARWMFEVKWMIARDPRAKNGRGADADKAGGGSGGDGKGGSGSGGSGAGGIPPTGVSGGTTRGKGD